jgi:hypothetical protein
MENHQLISILDSQLPTDTTAAEPELSEPEEPFNEDDQDDMFRRTPISSPSPSSLDINLNGASSSSSSPSAGLLDSYDGDLLPPPNRSFRTKLSSQEILHSVANRLMHSTFYKCE